MKIENLQDGPFQSFYAKRQQLNKEKAAPQKKEKIAAAALIGAFVPVIAHNLARGKGGALINAFENKGANRLKAASGLFQMNGYSDILVSSAGAVIAGTAAGIKLDTNNKDEKCKEGVFEFLNTMIPTTFAAIGECVISKKETKPMKAPRAALILGSVAGGMFIANKASNKINEKCFDGDKEKTKRKFKPMDCLVHMDDLIGIFVLSKNPVLKGISEKIQLDKLLPLLYARTGYEAGNAKKDPG